MINLILILIISAFLFFAVFFILKAKKSGNRCIGCPYSNECGGACGKERIDSVQNKNNK